MKSLLDKLKLLGAAFLLIAVVGGGQLLMRQWSKNQKPEPFEPAERITFSALAAGARPANSHLVVSGGILDLGHMVERVVRSSESALKPIADRRSIIPLVDEAAGAHAPVLVLFSAKAWAGYRLTEIAAAAERRGIWRDSGWDGQEAVRTEFERMGVKLAPNVTLLEEPAPE